MGEVVRITIREGEDLADVKCYQARNLVSALPAHLRHWEPAPLKVWKVDTLLLDQLARDMRRAGHTVVTDDRREPESNWCDGMFAALPPDLADQAYRALTRVLHPDWVRTRST
jgi:hypothetical protein